MLTGHSSRRDAREGRHRRRLTIAYSSIGSSVRTGRSSLIGSGCSKRKSSGITSPWLPAHHLSTANTTLLRGRAGQPIGEGWSRTVHYELSSKARANYQYNNAYRTRTDGDAHPVVAILTIDYASH